MDYDRSWTHICSPFSFCRFDGSDDSAEGESIQRHPPGWFFKYRLLLHRNFMSYVRDISNVLTRLAVGAMLAFMTGLVYQNLGANAEPKAIYDIFGMWEAW